MIAVFLLLPSDFGPISIVVLTVCFINNDFYERIELRWS